MILEPKTQNGSGIDQQSIRFPVKVEGVLRLCKMSKKHWSYSILERRKSWSEYLIEPVVYEDFSDQKRILALKSIKKALGFH